MRQRWVSVVGLVVVLWAAVGAVVPFHAAVGDCGAPVAEAFRGDDIVRGPIDPTRTVAGSPPTLPGGAIDESRAARLPDLRFAPPCRAPARRRLQRAGVIATAAVVGTVGAVFLLRVPGR